MSERQARYSKWEDSCPSSPYYKGVDDWFEIDVDDDLLDWIESVTKNL